MRDIIEVAKELDIKEQDVISYGKSMAKLDIKICDKKGKLILVTAVNPTPAGEGKTTISIGLADAMRLMGKSVCLALREPSLGPVFGMKGGATGGGQSRIIPSNNIDLHFTGDLHAITSANNLLSAMIDNHIYFGNELNIDRVVFNRCIDMNDRSLRDITYNIRGVERKEKFNITASSEIMAILCLAEDLTDLKRRLGNILVGFSGEKPIYARDLGAEEGMCVLLFDALKPNLVQTLEGTPAIVHGGPFANIAHGCNSVIATKTALAKADYVVTEAGFGADLGAEKFFDIKCRKAGLKPDTVVLVTTIRSMKYNAGVSIDNLNKSNAEAVVAGSVNLIKHIKNLKDEFGCNLLVVINRFDTDTDDELQTVKDIVSRFGVEICVADAFCEGGKGCYEVAEKVVKLCNEPNHFRLLYSDDLSIKEKCNIIATKIYGASGVLFSEKAEKELKTIISMGKQNLPIVIAKTQYSLSDDASLLGAPSGYTFKINSFELKSGAEFVVAIAGSMMLMPGLSRTPRALGMSVDENGYNL